MRLHRISELDNLCIELYEELDKLFDLEPDPKYLETIVDEKANKWFENLELVRIFCSMHGAPNGSSKNKEEARLAKWIGHQISRPPKQLDRKNAWKQFITDFNIIANTTNKNAN